MSIRVIRKLPLEIVSHAEFYGASAVPLAGCPALFPPAATGAPMAVKTRRGCFVAAPRHGVSKRIKCETRRPSNTLLALRFMNDTCAHHFAGEANRIDQPPPRRTETSHSTTKNMQVAHRSTRLLDLGGRLVALVAFRVVPRPQPKAVHRRRRSHVS